MPNKTAFVTGGTGFIGLNLVEHLTQSGWDVVALHRPKSRLMYLQKYPVRLVEGAIEDAASLDRAMPEDVDAVFHVAGDVSLWSGHKQRQWRTNVEGTRNMVATALAKRSRKFVHTSSTAVYGIPAEQFDETSPKLGKDSFNYQHSKAVAEEEVRKRGYAGIGCGLSESRECNRPLRLGHVVTVHSPSGERAIAAHSAGTRLLRRCGSRCAGASCGSREGSHRAQLYSWRKRGFLCRDCADGGQIARPTDHQYRRRPPAGIARRWPRLGMDIDDHRERATDFRGIGGNREREHHLSKRQGHPRTRLSARVARNHVQGLHRLDDRRGSHSPADSCSITGPPRREIGKRLNIRPIMRSYMRGGMSRLKRTLNPSRPGK